LSVSSPLPGPQSFDVAIIGGGIIGLLAARELTQAGARVAIFDRGSIGRESSWAGGGILSPLYPWRYPEPVTRLASWSQRAYPELVRALRQNTGIDAEYLTSGLLISSENDNDIACKWSLKYDNVIEILSPPKALELQPGLAAGDTDWLWMPQVAQVRNPRLIAAISSDLRKKGVEFIENSSISEFIVKNDRFQGLVSKHDRITAGQCLVASGAWSGQLMQQFGRTVPIEPVRGQMVLLKGRPGRVQRIVLKNSHYLIPRADGRILIGSTLEYVGYDKGVTESARQELLAAATDIFPDLLQQTTVETQWAGLRPGSPEGIPFIGEHPDIEGLVLCSGHYRNGFVLGPASARLAVDHLLQRPPIMDAAPYSLIR